VTLVPLVLSIGTIPGLSLELFQEADAIKVLEIMNPAD